MTRDVLYAIAFLLVAGLGYALGRAHAHELFLNRFYRLIFWFLTDYDPAKEDVKDEGRHSASCGAAIS